LDPQVGLQGTWGRDIECSHKDENN
jgi:hypothetical protein